MIVPRTAGSNRAPRDADWDNFKDFFFRWRKETPFTPFDVILYPCRVFIGALILGALKILEWFGNLGRNT